MLFGLINASIVFQGYINKILVEKLDIFVIVYLDNIFIYIESKGKKHVKAIECVLDKLQKHLLYAKLKKCQFYQKKLRFLGYIISYQSIQIEEK